MEFWTDRLLVESANPLSKRKKRIRSPRPARRWMPSERLCAPIMRGAPLRRIRPPEQTMSMPAHARRWTVAEVRAMQDRSRAWPRYELVDGELIVTPAPRPVHQRAVLLLARRLAEYVERHELGEVWTSPADIEMRPGTIVQPDIFVASRSPELPATAWTDLTSLAVVIEVTSPSTARHDRVAKRAFFQRSRVGEYWVVDLDARTVERSAPGDPNVQVSDLVFEWSPVGVATPFRLDLDAFFARVHGEHRGEG